MVTQTLISFKVDNDLVAQLEHFKSTYGISRNKLINYALRFAVDVVNLQEECVHGREVPNYIKPLL